MRLWELVALWREGLKKLFDWRKFFLSRVFGSFDEIACASKRRKEQVRAENSPVLMLK